jgi:ABC-type sugar transport system permease subunit
MRSPRDKFLRSSIRCSLSLACIFAIQVMLAIVLTILRYKGYCQGLNVYYFSCTFVEAIVVKIFMLTFINIFIVPIPFIFWGVALGRIIASPIKLGRWFTVIFTIPIVIGSGVFGFFFAFLFPSALGAIFHLQPSLFNID